MMPVSEGSGTGGGAMWERDAPINKNTETWKCVCPMLLAFCAAAAVLPGCAAVDSCTYVYMYFIAVYPYPAVTCTYRSSVVRVRVLL